VHRRAGRLDGSDVCDDYSAVGAVLENDPDPELGARDEPDQLAASVPRRTDVGRPRGLEEALLDERRRDRTHRTYGATGARDEAEDGGRSE
jgi:hypothetical protein